MDSEDLAAKLRFIRRVKAQMETNVFHAWFSMVLAVGLTYLDIYICAILVHHPFAGGASVVGTPAAGWTFVSLLSIMVLAAAIVSVLLWCSVNRDRERLPQLEAIASAMSSEDQPEVWPPPPNGPKG